MQPLFDHVPDAKMPPRATPPTRLQDTLERLRFSEQRLNALQRQQEAEIADNFELRDMLRRGMKVGQEVCVSGGRALRVRGGLDIQWSD